MHINSDINILIYSHLFPPSKGGMQFSNLEIAKGLSELGYNVSVIACYNKGIRDFTLGLPFPVVVLPKWPFTTMSSLSQKGLANWFFLPLYFYLIKMSIKRFKPNVIIVSDETANAFWGLLCPFLCRPYLSYCSVPQLSYPRRKGSSCLGYNIQAKIRKWMSYSYIRSRKVLAVSHSTKAELLKKLPALKNKIEVIPRSIDPIFFHAPIDIEHKKRIRKKYDIAPEDYVLLTVSRLATNKGIGDVIKSMSLLNLSLQEKMKYIIVGSGPNEQYLKNLVKGLKLEKKVIFVGSVPNDQLIPFYDICNIFLMPSRRGMFESFGRVFVEAAARKKPSVGVNAGGMTDIIERGKNGFLIEPGDIKELKMILEEVVNNKGSSEKMGTISRQIAEERFTRQAIAVEFEKYFIKELI